LPEWLSEIVEKLHAKKAADRFASGSEVAELLGRWLAHIEQPATSPAPARVERRAGSELPTGRKKWWRYAAAIAAAISLALLLAASTPWAFSPGHSAADETSPRTNSPGAVVDNAVQEPLTDEATLIKSYHDVRGKISEVYHDLSTSPPAQDFLETEIPHLRAQLEKLTKQIDQSGP
jgi:hypothetical protein